MPEKLGKGQNDKKVELSCVSWVEVIVEVVDLVELIVVSSWEWS